jgi:hypothetical protein
MMRCSLTQQIQEEPLGTCNQYLPDDIARGLQASLVAVLMTALSGQGTSPDFLKGVLSLAQSQAALYGISWSWLVQNLCNKPELYCLVQRLQDGLESV